MTDTDLKQLFNEVRVGLAQQKQQERKFVGEMVDQVFDAYRAALGEDFTTQGVLRAASYGAEVKHWDTITPEMQDVLLALGARVPKKVDVDAVTPLLAEGMVTYLREQGIVIPDDKVDLFLPAMKDIVNAVKYAGAKLDNGVQKAHILGLGPLVDYRNWLVFGGQQFMNLDDYHFELTMTDMALKAAQKAFVTGLVAAGEVQVTGAMLSQKTIDIVTAEAIQGSFTWNPELRYTYTTRKGEKGEIDLRTQVVQSKRGEKDEVILGDLLFDRKISEDGIQGLGYQGSIEALVGLPENVSAELRANTWRKYLSRFTVDFSTAAEAVFVDPIEKEKVTFFYGTKRRNGSDNGVMIALKFDERYRTRLTLAYTRGKMEEEIERAKRVKERFEAVGSSYTPLLEPMAVKEYVQNVQKGKRLTPSNL